MEPLPVKLEERHEHEQYFWDDQTLARLCDIVAPFENPCLLCAPMLGVAMAKRGRPVTSLDIDERFESVPGFMKWDAYRPRHLANEFDLIVCDPPFFNMRLSQLFAAIRTLHHFDTSRSVLVCFLERRENAILGTFSPFGLGPTNFYPTYKTVQRVDKNVVRFYSNFDIEQEESNGSNPD